MKLKQSTHREFAHLYNSKISMISESKKSLSPNSIQGLNKIRVCYKEEASWENWELKDFILGSDLSLRIRNRWGILIRSSFCLVRKSVTGFWLRKFLIVIWTQEKRIGRTNICTLLISSPNPFSFHRRIRPYNDMEP